LFSQWENYLDNLIEQGMFEVTNKSPEIVAGDYFSWTSDATRFVSLNIGHTLLFFFAVD
jgi:hypothetical protein